MNTKYFRNKLLKKTLASWCAFATLATTCSPAFAYYDQYYIYDAGDIPNVGDHGVLTGAHLNQVSGNVIIKTDEYKNYITSSWTFNGEHGWISLTGNSGTGVLNWKDLNIGKDQSLHFGNGTFYNAVTGGSKSNINGVIGRINFYDNPNVFIFNPAGIFIGARSTIDVGNFTAAAMAMSNLGDMINNPYGTPYFANPSGDVEIEKTSSHAASLTANKHWEHSSNESGTITLLGKNVTIEGGAFSGTTKLGAGSMIVIDNVNGGTVSFDVGGNFANNGNISLMGDFAGKLSALADGKVTVGKTVVTDDTTLNGRTGVAINDDITLGHTSSGTYYKNDLTIVTGGGAVTEASDAAISADDLVIKDRGDGNKVQSIALNGDNYVDTISATADKSISFNNAKDLTVTKVETDKATLTAIDHDSLGAASEYYTIKAEGSENSVNTLSATGSTIKFTNDKALELDGVEQKPKYVDTVLVNGELNITAKDSIKQTGKIESAGKASFDAKNGSVTLARSDNDFNEVSAATHVSGSTISITDKNDVTLGKLEGEKATIVAEGDIKVAKEEVGGQMVDVESSVKSVSLDGKDVAFVNDKALKLDSVKTAAKSDSTSKGDLKITANGEITQGNAMEVANNATISAKGNIVLDTAANKVNGTVGLTTDDGAANTHTANAAFKSAKLVKLAEGSVDGNLSVTAVEGDITTAVPTDKTLAVAGTTELNAEKGKVQVANVMFLDEVSAKAKGDVKIDDTATLTVGKVTTEEGEIELKASGIDADVVLKDGKELVVKAPGKSVKIEAADDVEIAGDITTRKDVTIKAGDAVTIDGSADFVFPDDTVGNLSINADGAVTIKKIEANTELSTVNGKIEIAGKKGVTINRQLATNKIGDTTDDSITIKSTDDDIAIKNNLTTASTVKIEAGDDISIENATVKAEKGAEIVAGDDIAFDGAKVIAGSFDSDGTAIPEIAEGDAANLKIEANGIAIKSSLVGASKDMTIAAKDGDITVDGSKIAANGKMEITAKDADPDDGVANGSITVKGDAIVLANGTLNAKADEDIAVKASAVKSTGTLSITATDDIKLTKATLATDDALAVKGDAVSVTESTITAEKAISVESGDTLTLDNTEVKGKDALTMTAKNGVAIADTTIEAGKTATVKNVANSIKIDNSTVKSVEKLTLETTGSEGHIALNKATLATDDDLAIKSYSKLEVTDSELTAEKNANIKSGYTATLSGAEITVKGDVDLFATKELKDGDTASTINVGGDLTVRSALESVDLDNTAVTVEGDTQITAYEGVSATNEGNDFQGKVVVYSSLGDIEIADKDTILLDQVMTGDGDITVEAEDVVLTEDASIASIDGDVTIDAEKTITTEADDLKTQIKATNIELKAGETIGEGNRLGIDAEKLVEVEAKDAALVIEGDYEADEDTTVAAIGNLDLMVTGVLSTKDDSSIIASGDVVLTAAAVKPGTNLAMGGEKLEVRGINGVTPKISAAAIEMVGLRQYPEVVANDSGVVVVLDGRIAGGDRYSFAILQSYEADAAIYAGEGLPLKSVLPGMLIVAPDEGKIDDQAVVNEANK